MTHARLALRVTPGARRTEIVGRYREGWKVSVAAPPERGRANADVVRLIARALDVPVARVTLVRGAAARDKVIEIEGITIQEAERRLSGGRRKGDL
jgi:uncharacterized protein (TIGR00251 family)